MGKVAEETEIDFVVSTGDNFLENGLAGVDDMAFHDSFMDVYTAKSLHKPWYLGNHHLNLINFRLILLDHMDL